jgi:hypothetical protein
VGKASAKVAIKIQETPVFAHYFTLFAQFPRMLPAFCRKTLLHFATKRPSILPHNSLHFAAKRNAFCGKTQRNMPQNAAHYAAKRNAILAQTALNVHVLSPFVHFLWEMLCQLTEKKYLCTRFFRTLFLKQTRIFFIHY